MHSNKTQGQEELFLSLKDQDYVAKVTHELKQTDKKQLLDAGEGIRPLKEVHV